jgi:hypothetical protein
VTLASEQELLTATLERLGLVFTRVGQTMYALNE